MVRQQVVAFVLIALIASAGFAAAPESPRVDVEVSGVDGELKRNALAFLSITRRQAQTATRPLSVSELERLHERAPREIQESLQPFGFYAARVSSSLTERTNGRWRATYHVTPGPQSRLSAVNFRLVDDDPEVRAQLDSAVQAINGLAGQPLDHRSYEQAKYQLVQRARRLGYLDARFVEAELVVNPPLAVAQARLAFEAGTAFQFGAIHVEQDILEPEFVERLIQISPGETFDSTRLVDLQLRLNDSRYFSAVVMEVERASAEAGAVPVTFRTTPVARQRWTAAVGFGTDTGPRVRAGLENRRVNRRGHRLRLDARASTLESALQLDYRIPIRQVHTDFVRGVARVERGDIGDAVATQYSVTVSQEDNWRGMRRRMFVRGARESFRFSGLPSQTTTLFYPGIALSAERFDSPSFTRTGHSFEVSLQGGDDVLGSDVSFLKFGLRGRLIRSLPGDWRLLVGAEYGHVETSRIDQLPPSLRFFAGGDRSVRGYAFESLSPEDALGNDVGGDTLLAASVEVDAPVVGAWRIAGFADAGTASRGSPDALSKGVGIGVRYQSPVGLIRLDLAHPLDDPDSSVRVHLSIGTDL